MIQVGDTVKVRIGLHTDLRGVVTAFDSSELPGPGGLFRVRDEADIMDMWFRPKDLVKVPCAEGAKGEPR